MEDSKFDLGKYVNDVVSVDIFPVFAKPEDSKKSTKIHIYLSASNLKNWACLSYLFVDEDGVETHSGSVHLVDENFLEWRSAPAGGDYEKGIIKKVLPNVKIKE